MGERWLDKVEARIDDVIGAAISVGHDSALEMRRQKAEDNAILDAERAALLELVTRGRCPVCGESTIPDCNVNSKHVDELCIACGWTSDEPLDSADDRP